MAKIVQRNSLYCSPRFSNVAFITFDHIYFIIFPLSLNLSISLCPYRYIHAYICLYTWNIYYASLILNTSACIFQDKGICLCNYSTVIKTGKLTLIQYYYLIYRRFQILSVSSNVLYSKRKKCFCSRIQSEIELAFCYHVSLHFGLEQFHSLSLSCKTLTFSNSIDQIFVECPSIVVCPMFPRD